MLPGSTTYYIDPIEQTRWTVTDGIAGVDGAFDEKSIRTETLDKIGRVITEQDSLRQFTRENDLEDKPLHQTSVTSSVSIGDVHSHQQKSTVDGLGRLKFNLSATQQGNVTSYDVIGLVNKIHHVGHTDAHVIYVTNATGDVLTHTENRLTPNGTGYDVTPYNTTMKYDQFGRRRSVTDAGGGSNESTVDYAYDTLFDANRVTTTSREGVITIGWFDAVGQLIREQNELGGITQFHYDPAGYLTDQTFTPDITNETTVHVQNHRDARGRVRGIATTTTGTGTRNTFQAFDYFDFGDDTADGWNSIAYVTLPGDGTTPVPTANKHHALRTRTDAQGTPVLIQSPDPADTPSNSVPTTTLSYTYVPHASIETTLVSAANVTTAGAAITSTDATQTRRSRQTFNAFGQPHQSEVFDVHVDASGNLQPAAWLTVSENIYHPITGRLASTNDALANQTSFTYDTLTGALASVTKPNGETTTYQHDSAGNRTRLIYSGAPSGEHGDTTWVFDALNRIKNESIVGVTEKREWDYGTSLQTVYNDGNDVDHTTTIDLAARTSTVIATVGTLTYERRQTLASDGSLRTVEETLIEGADTIYESDFAFDSDISDGESTDTYGFHFQGHDLDHEQRIELDDRGQIDERIFGFKGSSATSTELWRDDYDFDFLGRQTSLERTITDISGDVSSIWSSVDEPGNKRVEYGYNVDGSRTGIDRFDLSTANSTPVATSAFTYTLGGRVQEILHANDAGGTFLAKHGYQHDGAGRLLTQSDHYTNGIATDYRISDRVFAYDAASQLTQVTETIDANAAIIRNYADGRSSTSTDWTLGVDNRLAQDDRYDYEYNGEGQLTKRISRLLSSLGANDAFVWDPAGRLIRVVQHDTNDAVIQTIEYGYDANGLMRARRVLAADGTTITSSAGNLRDGLQILAELDLMTAAPVITKLYLHGTAPNEIVATDVLDNGAYESIWSFTDALGSLSTVASQSLGDWKVVHSTTTEYGGSPLQLGDTTTTYLMSLEIWAGHHRDPDTGLIEAKARWYDPSTGRFVSNDPIGFAAGDANLYRYVGNGPTTKTDPSGMNEEFPYVPESGGTWSGGRPGHGIWHPDKLPGVGIPYINGEPQFDKWAKMHNGNPVVVEIDMFNELSASDATRRRKDFERADSVFKGACDDWKRKGSDYTWHHLSVDSQGRGRLMLVETRIHRAASHAGAFSVWKKIQNAAASGDTKLLKELRDLAKHSRYLKVIPGAGAVLFVFSANQAYGAYKQDGAAGAVRYVGRDMACADIVEGAVMVPVNNVGEIFMLDDQGDRYRRLRAPFKHGIKNGGADDDGFWRPFQR